ncbi:MAG TPA: hypothetical protein VK576_04635 [Thermoleophilia bacterium]|nr:hypothetical protein [Thermoleophilia bacterium]
MSDPYADLKEYFATVEDVTVNAGRGSQGLKFGGKMFAMFYKGDLLVQLSPERVSQLIAAGDGLAFDPGTGKQLADRILIPAAKRGSWIDLCVESKQYAETR